MKIFSSLLSASLIALAFTSCSDHDADAPHRQDGSIAFNASAPLRAVTTTNTLKDFKVWAFADSKPYMSDVTVNKQDGNWTYSPVQYWPANTELNFYSYSPAISTTTASDDTNPDIPDFVNGGRTDLLYAVNIGEKRTGASAAPVQINFRHAMSQVRFRVRPRVAAAGEQAIAVRVHALDLLGTNSVGSFNFPTSTTAIGNDVAGKWTNAHTVADAGIFSGSEMLSTDTPVELLSTGYVFAIPQTLGRSTVDGSNYSGAYARVLCEIFDRSTGVKLWPADADADASGAAYVYFPLNDSSTNAAHASWEPGKAYRYTLNVAMPANSNKIDFDVTVEEFPDFIDVETGN